MNHKEYWLLLQRNFSDKWYESICLSPAKEIYSPQIFVQQWRHSICSYRRIWRSKTLNCSPKPFRSLSLQPQNYIDPYYITSNCVCFLALCESLSIAYRQKERATREALLPSMLLSHFFIGKNHGPSQIPHLLPLIMKRTHSLWLNIKWACIWR